MSDQTLNDDLNIDYAELISILNKDYYTAPLISHELKQFIYDYRVGYLINKTNFNNFMDIYYNDIISPNIIYAISLRFKTALIYLLSKEDLIIAAFNNFSEHILEDKYPEIKNLTKKQYCMLFKFKFYVNITAMYTNNKVEIITIAEVLNRYMNKLNRIPNINVLKNKIIDEIINYNTITNLYSDKNEESIKNQYKNNQLLLENSFIQRSFKPRTIDDFMTYSRYLRMTKTDFCLTKKVDILPEIINGKRKRSNDKSITFAKKVLIVNIDYKKDSCVEVSREELDLNTPKVNIFQQLINTLNNFKQGK